MYIFLYFTSTSSAIIIHFNFILALFLIRDDSFLTEIPESESGYFLKKSTASEKLRLFGDKISEKIPVSKNVNIIVHLEIVDILYKFTHMSHLITFNSI